MRIGSGYDVHAFGPGEFVILGGVRIPFERALQAHSDGDVLIHALIDALLGAAALGDIGQLFPPSDERWANVDSRILLRDVRARVADKGYVVGNVDLTLICELPKVAPHRAQIVENLALDLQIEKSCISVKATTTEGLGFSGRGEGIAAQASVLIMPVAGN